MKLIYLLDGRPVMRTDVWTDVDDEARLPESGPIIVSRARWQDERYTLLRRNTGLGVRLASDETLDGLPGDLDRLDLIALDFPNLNDGRHFTTARLLRERYGFEGEIRATGQVLRDQLFAMARCGFDSFALQTSADIDGARRALTEISVVFQPAADGRLPAAALRGRPHNVMAAAE